MAGQAPLPPARWDPRRSPGRRGDRIAVALLDGGTRWDSADETAARGPVGSAPRSAPVRSGPGPGA
ncbi:MAG: hypothetical protein AVDCRST_MAG49-232 [uncultured Thermomicrobiales bacterium]|uniref:Uncharacterized protein n=1 Tax=uncultured Thermomicrobiales bacterium TaxID=1645740 RepID=A0A6J4TZJ8_9BACT|nr:MAG: hypothetical protein AVDCRST_MAG49-232 [uncultured Thermomicrobiales bacterium]